MKQIVLQLNWLEIFFIITTIISLFFNIVQWRDRRNLQLPVSNSLLAMFNDVKNKGNHVSLVQQLLYSPAFPHKDLQTLKFEYAHFTQTVMNYLWGFQEAIVGILVTLNPDDKEGHQAFRATDYGLTADEKQWRKEWIERLRAQQTTQQAAPAHDPGGNAA
jgi:hypothetical protein